MTNRKPLPAINAFVRNAIPQLFCHSPIPAASTSGDTYSTSDSLSSDRDVSQTFRFLYLAARGSILASLPISVKLLITRNGALGMGRIPVSMWLLLAARVL